MPDKLEQRIRAYFQKQKEVVAVYLFGSYAMGKEQHLSDIDIGLLFDVHDRTLMEDKMGQYVLELSRILRKDIHTVILNFAGPELLGQIFTKGKCLLVKDARKVAKYEMVQFAKIADFCRYRSMMQSGLIKKIMGGQSLG